MIDTELTPVHIGTLIMLRDSKGRCTHSPEIQCRYCPFNNTRLCTNDERMLPLINELLSQKRQVQLELF